MRGFSLVELLIAISVLAILATLTIAGFYSFRSSVNLDEEAEKLVSVLRLAQNKTVASVDGAVYGVRFEANKYILFTGLPYGTSSPSNEIFNLPSGLEISSIGINGGGQEIVFSRLTGGTQNWGEIALRILVEPFRTKTVYIASSGAVSVDAFPSSSSGRIIDSRHVHFGYSRTIDTANEILSLTFDDPPNSPETEEIIINNYLVGGQLYWQGTVAVGGSEQIIEIKTHQLNNSSTTFSINRDRRYNNKALSIFLSGDAGNSLIEYTADGTTTPGSSVFASEPQWQ